MSRSPDLFKVGYKESVCQYLHTKMTLGMHFLFESRAFSNIELSSSGLKLIEYTHIVDISRQCN